MECQLLIDSKYLIVYDKKNGQEVEIFPMDLVRDPTSVVSDDKKDIYNNILLFTVLEDPRRNGGPTATTPTEMHIFQCIHTHSAEIVDEIYKVKESYGSSTTSSHSHQQNLNHQHHQHNQHSYNRQQVADINPPQSGNGYFKLIEINKAGNTFNDIF